MPEDWSLLKLVRFLVLASMLPLFPLHGLYVAALTRPRCYIAIGFALLLPTAGLYGVIDVLRGMPAEFLTGVRMLALFGALYGSLKALAHLGYSLVGLRQLGFLLCSLVAYSRHSDVAPASGIYFSAVVLITVGLLLAGYFVQARYGDVAFDRIGGLARPMPRFATLLALLTMAAVGLPPFGLFSGYIGMLLHPSIEISWELSIIMLTWFAASFNLFRMMQRLLFGPASHGYSVSRPTPR